MKSTLSLMKSSTADRLPNTMLMTKKKKAPVLKREKMKKIQYKESIFTVLTFTPCSGINQGVAWPWIQNFNAMMSEPLHDHSCLVTWCSSWWKLHGLSPNCSWIFGRSCSWVTFWYHDSCQCFWGELWESPLPWIKSNPTHGCCHDASLLAQHKINGSPCYLCICTQNHLLPILSSSALGPTRADSWGGDSSDTCWTLPEPFFTAVEPLFLKFLMIQRMVLSSPKFFAAVSLHVRPLMQSVFLWKLLPKHCWYVQYIFVIHIPWIQI